MFSSMRFSFLLVIFLGVAMPAIAFPLEVRQQGNICANAGHSSGIIAAQSLPCVVGSKAKANKVVNRNSDSDIPPPEACAAAVKLMDDYNAAFNAAFDEELRKYPQCGEAVDSGTGSGSAEPKPEQEDRKSQRIRRRRRGVTI